MDGFSFEVHGTCPDSDARRGTFTTPHGEMSTPAFMPVGTRGTVKGVQPRDLAQAGARMMSGDLNFLASEEQAQLSERPRQPDTFIGAAELE